MNIIIINGSPRKSGATGNILKEIQNFLSLKKDVSIKLFNLSEYDMKFCKGCMLCYKTGSCSISSDGINGIIDQIKESDAVILSSPTYVSTVSGQLKTFFDRGGFVFGQLLYGKYGFTVGTYENAAGNSCIKLIQKILLLSGASRRGKFLVKLNYNSDPFKNSKYLKSLHKSIDIFYNSVKRNKGMSIFEKIIYKIVINIALKPRVLKYPNEYEGIIKRWKQINLL